MYTTEHYQETKVKTEGPKNLIRQPPLPPTPSQGLDDHPKIIVKIVKVRK